LNTKSEKNFAAKIWDGIAPIKFFIIIGCMEGLGTVLGFITAPHIDGVVISLLSQTIVPFSIICSLVFLNSRYTYWQLFSAMLVLCGGIISLVPQLRKGLNAELIYSIITAVSTLPGAIAFTLKELLFAERKKEGLDIFIVNTHGSLFQLLFQPIFIPLCVILKATNGVPLYQYVVDGLTCFTGVTPEGQGLKPDACNYSYIIYFIYVSVNLSFNILLLLLVKKTSSLLSFMTLKVILPIAVILFLFDWPIIGPSTISFSEVISLVVISIGLVCYRWTSYIKEENKLGCCSFYLPFCNKKETIVN